MHFTKAHRYLEDYDVSVNWAHFGIIELNLSENFDPKYLLILKICRKEFAIKSIPYGWKAYKSCLRKSKNQISINFSIKLVNIKLIFYFTRTKSLKSLINLFISKKNKYK